MWRLSGRGGDGHTVWLLRGQSPADRHCSMWVLYSIKGITLTLLGRPSIASHSRAQVETKHPHKEDTVSDRMNLKLPPVQQLHSCNSPSSPLLTQGCQREQVFSCSFHPWFIFFSFSKTAALITGCNSTPSSHAFLLPKECVPVWVITFCQPKLSLQFTLSKAFFF